MSSMFMNSPLLHHPTTPSGKPYYKSMAFGTWEGVTKLYRNSFINWETKTSTGANQYVICLNPYGSDYIQPHHFYDTTFDNVHPDAMAWLYSPPSGWANLKDCGEFPCTAPLNVLFSFIRTKFSSKQTFNYGSTFQVIANNPGVSPYLKGCKAKPKNNAYICTMEHLSTLVFESEDLDTKDRGMQPIYINEEGTQ